MVIYPVSVLRVLGVSALLMVSTWANADHEIEDYWQHSGNEYGTQQAACAGLDPQPTSDAYATRSAWAPHKDGSISYCSSDVQQCSNAGRKLSECGSPLTLVDRTTTSPTIGHGTRVKAHDDEEDSCYDLNGQTFDAYYGYDEPPPSCNTGCEVIGTGLGVGMKGRWFSSFSYTGQACDAADPPDLPKPNVTEVPDSSPPQNKLTDASGDETTYPAPDAPPADADPATEGDQPPIPDETATDAQGNKAESFPMAGGGDVFVVTDSNGNVTFTDKDPITGTGQYAVPDASGGGTDGTSDGASDGTTGGGTGDGGTDGGTGDGGTDGGTDGTADGGEEEEGEETSASGGGACDTAPTCDGDAILCAVLSQQWKLRCEATVPAEAEFLAETGLSEFTDVEGLLYETVDLNDTLNSGMFDTSGFGSGGGCPSDPSISMFGQTFTIPLEHPCWMADKIGYLVMIIATIVCVRIVAGSE